MVDEGLILPNSLVSDIPIRINGYIPDNYDRSFTGALPASEALAKSLNIPAVLSLQEYGIEKFRRKLQSVGFTTIQYSSEHYGLPLILGGAEICLWDLASAYASMGRTLLNFYDNNGKYNPRDFKPPELRKNDAVVKNGLAWEAQNLSAASIWETFEAMKTVIRPDIEGDWQKFESSEELAWKTGTSYGHRDAWAVGVNSKFTVAVWVGNADGEGRPGTIGVSAAAPILFNIFNFLPDSDWFEEPYDEMSLLQVCTKSGFLAGLNCEKKDTLLAPTSGLKSKTCPYHKMIHVDNEEQFQVNSNCADIANINSKNWFSLPPLESYYYRRHHPEYREIPSMRSDCYSDDSGNTAMQLIYPFEQNKIYIPIDLDGEKSKAVFKATHRKPDKKIYWHLDEEYMGTTSVFSQYGFQSGSWKT